MSKILLISDDVVSSTVAGPGIRYIELASALSKNHEVRLVVQPGTGMSKEKFQTLNIPVFIDFNLGIKIRIPNSALKKEFNKYDFIINQGWTWLAFGRPKIEGKVIIDLYCPWFLEDLESARFRQDRHNTNRLPMLKKMLSAGDFILCANEKQKDLYLGLLLETKKNCISNYKKDPSFKSQIAVVPTGISSTPPRHTRPVLKGLIPGIAPTDKVILWWGGIWDWLDPETAIRAVAMAAKKRADLRLIFFGIKHPHQTLTSKAEDALRLAKELGVYERQVFFIQKWVPFAERADWLLESDLGIITHLDTLETRFSWRTRVLDYFWASLPVITTEGDSMAELVDRFNLGRTVRTASPDDLAEKILELLDNDEQIRKIKKNIENFKPALYWEKVIEPIERFIAAI